jgi:hypothetical protein
MYAFQPIPRNRNSDPIGLTLNPAMGIKKPEAEERKLPNALFRPDNESKSH